VGTVLRTCDGNVPWWRVVGAGGHIRTPIDSGQADLLRAEGALVVDRKVKTVRNR
jgi:alkylated DNA nucleotide flippase Atl1